jgi:hypothetical protein
VVVVIAAQVVVKLWYVLVLLPADLAEEDAVDLLQILRNGLFLIRRRLPLAFELCRSCGIEPAREPSPRGAVTSVADSMGSR